MTDPMLTREERLAARLRENLRLRKAQARAIKSADGSPAAGALANPGLSKDEGEG